MLATIKEGNRNNKCTPLRYRPVQYLDHPLREQAGRPRTSGAGRVAPSGVYTWPVYRPPFPEVPEPFRESFQ